MHYVGNYLDQNAHFSVSIASIKEVREGSTTDAFTQCPDIYLESQCFSIIHGDDFSTLDLVFPTPEDFLHWTVGLRYLLAKKSGMNIFYSGRANIFVSAYVREDAFCFFQEVTELCPLEP